jgi:signal transduction histidine kinase
MEKNMGVEVENLKDSKEFLNIIFDHITSAIFLVDKDLRIREFNDSFKTLFYKSDDLILGHLCGNALGCIYTVKENSDCGTSSNCGSCQLRGALLNTFLKKVPANRMILIRDFIIHEVKVQKYLQYSTRILHYNNEEMIIVIVDDITENENQKLELEKKNKRLEEVNLQKNELLGIAAHDLRNPLGVISSFSEIMLEALGELKEENLKEMLGIVYKTSNFSLQLLNDILDYSKIESGVLDLKYRHLDYIQFIRENLARNEILSIQKSIPIYFDPPKKELIIDFDSHKIDQVLNNLINNSIKYSYPGNGITVSVMEDAQYVITSVKDKGQGIPEKDLPHLFEPFRQMSVKSTHNEKGSGLGLAIVKKIIDGHKGKILVTSEKGQGSEFSFYLPKKCS